MTRSDIRVEHQAPIEFVRRSKRESETWIDQSREKRDFCAFVTAMTATLDPTNDRLADISTLAFYAFPREKRETFSLCREQTRGARSFS
jgi:hypothetical protein